MAFNGSSMFNFARALKLDGSFVSAVLAGARTLTKLDGQLLRFDPDGSHRDVTLPTVSAEDAGYFFVIANWAGGAENLVIKDAAASTIVTVNQSECGVVYVDSAGAWQAFGVFTYAPS
jgi:hypothetical protein